MSSSNQPAQPNEDNTWEIPSDAMDSLFDLFQPSPSTEDRLQAAVAHYPSALDMDWLMEISESSDITGLLLMFVDPEHSTEIRIARLTGQYLDPDFWYEHYDFALLIAQEHLDFVDVPLEGLTISWELAERSDNGDLYKPFIQEFSPHLKAGPDSPLSMLHRELIAAAQLRPVHI